jgi:iron complex outermembrane receptor protein
MGKTILLSTAGAMALAATAPATAQTETAALDTATTQSAFAGNDIIVTARKREENLIDVPLAITALSQEAIQQAGIEDVSDLSQQVPGFSFRQGFGRTGSSDGGASVRPSIRGMSNVLGAPNAGFFVDGIFVSGNITSYQLDNLERVEVIRGPQSALFGRQTFSGAINFVTRKPGNELTGRVNATIGQYDNYELSGYVVAPLVQDRFSAEINARVYKFGGDYVNQDSGKRDINDQESKNFGVKFRITPSSNLEIILNAAYGHDRDKGYSSFLLGSANLNCFLPNIVGTVAGIPRSSNRSRGYFCGEIESPRQFSYNNNEIEALGYHPLERSYFRSSASMELTTDSDWTITGIAAYNWQENQNGFDNTYLPSTNPSLTIEGRSNVDYSLEMRVQSPADKPIRGLVGAYYYRGDDTEGFTVNTVSTNVNFGRKSGFKSADAVRNIAAFGLIELDVTDRFTVTGEARYQEDRITGSLEIGVLNGMGAPTNIRTTTYRSFLPRATARFELTPNWNLYGSVAKGNKPGGFNDLPADSTPSFTQEFLDLGIDTFDEEEVWSYELGTKGQVNGFSFNVALFYLDWTKQQLTQSRPYQRLNNSFTTLPFIVNAGQSEIKGIEAELSGPVTDWLSVRLAYAYTDAKFVDFYDENTEQLLDTEGRPSFLDADFTIPNPADVDGPNGQVRGNRLPQTPVHQATITGNIEFPVSDTMDVFLRGDLAYESKRYVQVHNLAHTGDSYNLNIRTGFKTGPITITAFVENVLNDRTPMVGTRLFDFNRTLLIPDPVRTFAGQPVTLSFYRDFLVSSPRRRQFGLTANYRF